MQTANLFQKRLESFTVNPQADVKRHGANYQKEWSNAVNHFVIRINKDRKYMKPTTYMAVRNKLLALREIHELRDFYKVCDKYSRKKGEEYSFSRCFWGSLKITK